MKKFNLNRPMLLTLMFTAILMFCIISPCLANEEFFSQTYSMNDDFEEGVMEGVYSEDNSLWLKEGASTFSFIWIANSAESTVSKIDTKTGREMGRYRTGGSEVNWDPSRTAVDGEGNCWVANRAGGNQPTIVKILSTDWTDKNHDGIMQTSEDSNGNWVIDPDEILPWGQDERVVVSYPVGNWDGIARSIALDRQGYVWVGLWNEQRYVKIDPLTGSQLASVSIAPGNPYGAAVDKDGILWSATCSNILAKFDTESSSPTATTYTLDYNNYGIAVDQTGNVWLGGFNCDKLLKFDPVSETASYYQGAAWNGRGLAVDKDGNIWLARSDNNTVEKYLNDGTYCFSVQVGSEPIGVGVDTEGNIWVINRSSNNATKIAPDGTVLDVYPTGNGPYTYSDMTGFSLHNFTNRFGTWTTIVDSGRDNAPWGTIEWDAMEPDGTKVSVRVRSAQKSDNLASSPWIPVTNGQDFDSLNGRYLQIEAKLSSTKEASPELFEISVQTAVGQAVLKVEPSYLEKNEGSKFSVDLKAYGVSNLYAADITLNYNPSVLKIENPTNDVIFNTTNVFSNGFVIESIPGLLHISATRIKDYYGFEGFTGDSVLATVYFQTCQQGESSLDLSNVDFCANSGTQGSEVISIPIGRENGYVKVTMGNIFGSVRLDGLPADKGYYGGVTVYITGSDNTYYTDTEGKFALPNLEPGNYTLVVYNPVYLRKEIPFTVTDRQTGYNFGEILLLTGDINISNVVNFDDLMVLAGTYGKKQGQQGFLPIADLNRNTKVDLVDLVLLARNYTTYGDGGQMNTLLLCPGIQSQSASPGQVFYSTGELIFDKQPGARVILSAHPDGTGKISASDYLTLDYICNGWYWWGEPYQYWTSFYYDFWNQNAGNINDPVMPLDLTDIFTDGSNTVKLSLQTRYNNKQFSTPLYLSVQAPQPQ